MKLSELPDDIKVRAFNLILEKYDKDSELSDFGRDVQVVLKNLRELFK